MTFLVLKPGKKGNPDLWNEHVSWKNHSRVHPGMWLEIECLQNLGEPVCGEPEIITENRRNRSKKGACNLVQKETLPFEEERKQVNKAVIIEACFVGRQWTPMNDDLLPKLSRRRQTDPTWPAANEHCSLKLLPAANASTCRDWLFHGTACSYRGEQSVVSSGLTMVVLASDLKSNSQHGPPTRKQIIFSPVPVLASNITSQLPMTLVIKLSHCLVRARLFLFFCLLSLGSSRLSTVTLCHWKYLSSCFPLRPSVSCACVYQRHCPAAFSQRRHFSAHH